MRPALLSGRLNLFRTSRCKREVEFWDLLDSSGVIWIVFQEVHFFLVEVVVLPLRCTTSSCFCCMLPTRGTVKSMIFVAAHVRTYIGSHRSEKDAPTQGISGLLSAQKEPFTLEIS